ncbi:hypothetical protein [Microbacterium sp. No. 7]|uniref:hypothetical protein n=1 Tax=Microbacterium sp. No. 7 TaxID=1714373 RepID=UPI0006D0AF6E|nr:hypothetical protein [Microbacterium sp. No. 7]ALJ22034.1 hypothetical protein AOA12_19920 [Microbacterium sp. No. 7]
MDWQSLVEALATPVLMAGSGIVGGLLTSAAQKRAARVQAEAQATSRENHLIDQLQEELSSSRTEQAARMLAQEERMTGLEERNGILVDRTDRYRDLLHKHRSHIWDGKPPPPPEWPDDLPR